MLALIVVLVALGIGVLIGNAGGSSPIKGPITVVLSGSGATATGSGGAAKSSGKPAGTTTSAATPKVTTTSASDFAGS